MSCQVEDLEDAYRLLTTSRSWKITAPLRKGKLIVNYLLSYLSPRKHYLFFSVATGAALKGAHWVLVDRTAQLTVASSKRRMPIGWARFSRCEPAQDTPSEFALYIDEGEGFSEHSRQRLCFGEDNTCLVRLPRLVRGLRIDPLNAQPKFTLVGFQVKELTAFRVLLGALLKRLLRTSAREFPALVAASVRALWYGGALAFEEQILGERLSARDKNRLYKKWTRRYDRTSKSDVLKFRERSKAFPHRPLLSVLMPVYNSPERWLREAIESVLAQAYENWELCIADDASTRPSVRKVLEEFVARDARVRVTYRSENGHISRSSNTALEMARGDYVVLMDHDDSIPPHALYYVARELNRYPEADLVFSDEDRLSENGQRVDPYFKLGWDAELLRSQNLISHLGVYRTSLARKIGGFRAGYEGSQDWDFALRFIESIPHSHIRHIPRVLYHWRMAPGTVSFTVDTKTAAFGAAESCVRDHLERLGVPAAVERDPISQANRIRYVSETSRSAAAVIHFQNGIQQVQEVLAQIVEPYVLFLHDGTRARGEGGIEELIARLEQPGVGAVGGRVWLRNGCLDNSGLRLSVSGVPIAMHSGLPNGEAGYFGHAALAHEVWAVGLDALLIRKEVAAQVIGKISNVQEFALQICRHVRESGMRIIWTPYANFENDDAARLNPPAWPHTVDAKAAQRALYNPNLSDFTGQFCLAFPPAHQE